MRPTAKISHVGYLVALENEEKEKFLLKAPALTSNNGT